MTFQIQALPRAPFAALFPLDDAALAARHIRRVTADAAPGYPCRIGLRDAEIGETLLLLNYRHLDVASPYTATHAIYVSETAEQAQPAPGEVPDVLARRLLSVRGFDAGGYMVEADITPGTELAEALDALLAHPKIAFVDIHNAKRGCFAARARRAIG